MQYEVENKYWVSEPRTVLHRLMDLGAEFQEVVDQVDVYFGHPVRDFASTDEALRIRRVGERNWITYKGPKLDQATKTRQEIELPLVGGPELVDAYTSLLAAVGLSVAARVEKRRRPGCLRWRDRWVDVCLDEVVGLGQFVELEIVSEADQLPGVQAAVVELAETLGLLEPERRSYLEMLLAADVQ